YRASPRRGVGERLHPPQAHLAQRDAARLGGGCPDDLQRGIHGGVPLVFWPRMERSWRGRKLGSNRKRSVRELGPPPWAGAVFCAAGGLHYARRPRVRDARIWIGGSAKSGTQTAAIGRFHVSVRVRLPEAKATYEPRPSRRLSDDFGRHRRSRRRPQWPGRRELLGEGGPSSGRRRAVGSRRRRVRHRRSRAGIQGQRRGVRLGTLPPADHRGPRTPEVRVSAGGLRSAGLLPLSGWTTPPPLVRRQEDREGDREILEKGRRRVSEVRGDVGRGLRPRRADAPRPAGPDRRTGFAPPRSGSRGPPPAPAVLQRGRTPRRILRIGRGQGRL